MFISKRWAAAFVNSFEKEDGNIEDGINTLKALADFADSLPGIVSGRAAAEMLEPLVRNAMTKAGQEAETAVRFFLLMVKKNAVCHVDSIIEEIKKILDKKNGVIHAFAEYAHEPEKDFISEINQLIKKMTGAASVELTGQINPELIGGYRLKIGDEIIDASVRRQLQKMEACLAAGDGGNQWQITGI
jgi:F-type H+-transporting ATPase subunit delta